MEVDCNIIKALICVHDKALACMEESNGGKKFTLPMCSTSIYTSPINTAMELLHEHLNYTGHVSEPDCILMNKIFMGKIQTGKSYIYKLELEESCSFIKQDGFNWYDRNEVERYNGIGVVR